MEFNSICTRDKVLYVISKILCVKPEAVDTLASLESMGVDSTEIVEMVVALSKEFLLPIRPSEVKNVFSLQEVVDVVENKLALQEKATIEADSLCSSER
jgi:acyl carrier protein